MLVRIWFCRAALACPHRRICWRIDDLASARQRPRRDRLNAGFTTRGGDLLNAPAFLRARPGAGLGRRDAVDFAPIRNGAGWNAMKRGIEFHPAPFLIGAKSTAS